jgi:hypothetical protein
LIARVQPIAYTILQAHSYTAKTTINELIMCIWAKKLIAKDGEGGTGSSSGLTHSRPFGESIEPPKNDVGYTGYLYDTDLGLSYM